MIITETTERECCQYQDLVDVNRVSLGQLNIDLPKAVWCKHCGRRHEYFTYTDAAGSKDWDYRRVQK